MRSFPLKIFSNFTPRILHPRALIVAAFSRGLTPQPFTGHCVNAMNIGYAEIDGVEARVLPEGDKKAPAQPDGGLYKAETNPDGVRHSLDKPEPNSPENTCSYTNP